VFERVTIRATDRDASERFYGVVLRSLGAEQSRSDARDARWGVFIVREADEANPPTRRVHLGFTAQSRGRVDEFWRIGTGAGYRDDGQPGLRPEYGPDYYGGFLLDPDGNSAEAVHHDLVGDRDLIDHIWIRVADVAVAKRFYAAVGRHARFELRTDTPERGQLAGPRGSFSVVAGTPTEHLHMAFAAAEDDVVDAFHRELTEAGYRSLDAPAERRGEERRAYAAMVADPDGNRIELVHFTP
jgi:predicted lactoylglutathione lyase